MQNGIGFMNAVSKRQLYQTGAAVMTIGFWKKYKEFLTKNFVNFLLETDPI